MGFDSYHPMINLIYFAAAITGTLCFHHPVYLGISYVCAFLYSVKLNGKKALLFNLGLIPLILGYGGLYSYYNHFGITSLKTNFIGNQITMEALVYGLMIAVTAAAALMYLSCVFAVVSSDKVVYLFGRISPRLSLFLSILLRSVPRIKARGRRIGLSRQGIGKGMSQGRLYQRLRHGCGFCSILITWTLEDLVDSAASMNSRGYSLPGRTAFSIYRFDNRDRSFVILMFLGLILTGAAWALNQTAITYAPEIIINRITAMSFLFYGAYAGFLLLPLLAQLYSERRFRKQAGK